MTTLVSRIGAALLRVRWLVRLPVWLYRARLGVVFGDRLLMVEHRGRNSGRRRYAVLEVVDHPYAGRWVVVSGFGDRAQWFRNVRRQPEVRLYRRSHRPVRARAVVLPPDAAGTALARYARAHPRAWARLRPVLAETLGAGIDASGTQLPMIAFDERGGGTVPPGPADASATLEEKS